MSDAPENGTARAEVKPTPAERLNARLASLKDAREVSVEELRRLDAHRASVVKRIDRLEGGILECEELRKLISE